MKKIYSLFKSLLKNWTRSKTGMFFSILFPVMLLLVFGAVFGGQTDSQYTLHVKNNDLNQLQEPTNLSKQFTQTLNSTNSFELEKIDPETNLSKYVDQNDVNRVLVISSGFQQNTLNKTSELRSKVVLDTLYRLIDDFGEELNESQVKQITEGISAIEERKNASVTESGKITLYMSGGDQSNQIVKSIISGVIESFNKKLLGLSDAAIELNLSSLAAEDLNSVSYYLPGIIAAFIMANGIIGVTANVSEYKRNGVLKRLASSPLTKFQWIAANIAQQTLLAFLLTLVMVFLGIIVFGVEVHFSFIGLALILIGSFAFTSIGLILGGIIKDVEAANGIGNAIAFPLMFLSGAFWPIQLMPGYMQTIAKLLPLYYFHQGLLETIIKQNPQQALVPLGILVAFCLISVFVAIRVTRWKDL